MFIRNELLQDQQAVYMVNAAAFETTVEAELINVLRKEA